MYYFFLFSPLAPQRPRTSTTTAQTQEAGSASTKSRVVAKRAIVLDDEDKKTSDEHNGDPGNDGSMSQKLGFCVPNSLVLSILDTYAPTSSQGSLGSPQPTRVPKKGASSRAPSSSLSALSHSLMHSPARTTGTSG